MKKGTVISLIIAGMLILLGAGLFAGAMSAIGWDFSKLSSDEFVTQTVEITKSFVAIEIEADTAKIRFVASQDDTMRVEYGDIEPVQYRVEVDNGILKIEVVDTREWYDYISIGFTPASYVTVYLPAGEYGALTIRHGTGDIELPDAFTFFELDIELSTGDVTVNSPVRNAVSITTDTGDISLTSAEAGALAVKTSTGSIKITNVSCAGDVSLHVGSGKSHLTNLRCQSLASTGSSGDITMKDVIASGAFEISRDTGDVTLERCDAASIKIQTDTGDVTGSLLSDKVFVYRTDTGDVDLPDTTTGGKCDISTDTGDIEIRIYS